MSNETLTFDTAASAEDMAETMFGAGVQVVSATYTGDAMSSGIYANGTAAADNAVPADSGVILSTGNVADFAGSNDAEWTSTATDGVDGDRFWMPSPVCRPMTARFSKAPSSPSAIR